MGVEMSARRRHFVSPSYKKAMQASIPAEWYIVLASCISCGRGLAARARPWHGELLGASVRWSVEKDGTVTGQLGSV
jgi:hypothetical protein